MRRSWALVLALLVLSPVSRAAQRPSLPPPPTFRSGVRIIEVDVTVRDAGGAFVTGLTRDDFEILENGRPQEIVSLSEVSLPVDRRGRPTDAPTATASSAPGHETTDLGRVYVLVLNSGDPERVRRIARQFVTEFLGPTDLMAVMLGERSATQGLTNDQDSLLAAIERYRGGGSPPLRTIKEVAVNLNAVSGRRKAILFIGDSMGDVFSRAGERELDDTVRTAVRNNVRVYPIDPRGFLVRFGDMTGNAPADSPNNVGIRTPGVAQGTGGGGGSSLGESMAHRILAHDTGGTAIANTGNYGGNFGHIVRDNSAYYVLGFYASGEPDGAFHPVTIQVKDRPRLEVRARAGYRAASPDVKGRSVKLPKRLSTDARETLRASEPTLGLPLEIFTAVFQAERYEGSILIGCHVPGSTLALTPNEKIELSYVAVDRWGVVRAAERRAFTMTFDEEVRTQVAQTGLRLFGRLRLPRGTYTIRAAAHQPGGATGSAVTEVEIPDYAELPLSISDLVVASSQGPALVTLEEDAVLRRALPGQPTPRRTFARSETLTVFGEIYDSHWILTREIGVTTVIRSQDGRVIAREEQTLTSSGRGRFYYTGRVPLDSFAPGGYLLTLEAYTRDGVPASVSQQLRFEVDAERALEGGSGLCPLLCPPLVRNSSK